MCHNRFTIQVDLFKCKGFKDGGSAYKITGSSHLNVNLRWPEHIYMRVGYIFESRFSAGKI